MLVNQWIDDIHANAVTHGWWESERTLKEILALIHSEWSEALEEDRASRPMEYRVCFYDPEEKVPCNPKKVVDCRFTDTKCKYRDEKPEGIAVELIDGCIRIMDYMGFCEFSMGLITVHDMADIGRLLCLYDPDETLAELVANLHYYTAEAMLIGKNPDMQDEKQRKNVSCQYLKQALEFACAWLEDHGYDPEIMIREKHEYNKTRPYKHNKLY